MIYNLTEAAQEFLSANRPTKSTLHCQSIGSQEEISLEENLTNSAREAFLEARIHAHRSIYRLVVEARDLFMAPSLFSKNKMHLSDPSVLVS